MGQNKHDLEKDVHMLVDVGELIMLHELLGMIDKGRISVADCEQLDYWKNIVVNELSRVTGGNRYE